MFTLSNCCSVDCSAERTVVDFENLDVPPSQPVVAGINDGVLQVRGLYAAHPQSLDLTTTPVRIEFALAQVLQDLATNATPGVMAFDGVTYTARTITGAANEITVADGDGAAGDPTISLADIGAATSVSFPTSVDIDAKGRVTSLGESSANLAGIDALDTTGITARTGSGTFATRSITGTVDEIEVSNGDGVSGDPTIGLATIGESVSVSYPVSVDIDNKGRVTSLGESSANLAGIDALNATGITARTGSGTFATRSITGIGQEIEVSNGDGVSGNPTISLADIGAATSVSFPTSVDIDAKGRVTSLGESSANLAGIDDLSTTGITARTGSGTFATRSVTGTVGEITVSNGDGVSGNPTIELATIGESASVSFPTSVDIDAKGRVTSLGESSANLAGIDALNATGITARTGSGTFATRSITGTVDEIEVSNGDGVSGDPTIGLATIGESASVSYPTSVDIDAKGRVTALGEGSANLAGIDALDATGITARTGSGTFATRSIAGTVGEITVSNGDGVSGNPTIELATIGESASVNYPVSVDIDNKGRVTALGEGSANLAGIDALSSTGITARTGSGTFATRSIAGAVGEITVSNGDGVSGNPTIELATIGESASVSFPTSVDIDAKGRVTALGEGSANLAGLDALETTGIVLRGEAGVFETREIKGTNGEVDVTNGDGEEGDPTIGLATIGESASVSYPVSVDIDNKGRVTSLGESSANLAGIDGLGTTGITARTGSGTFATRSIAGTVGEIDVTNGDGVSGNPTIELATIGESASVNYPVSVDIDNKGRVTALGEGSANLAGIDALSSTGITARTGSGTFATRSITGIGQEIDVTNGDGVSGNPTIGLADVGTAGSTNFPSSISVDAKGRVTSVGATSANLTGVDALASIGLVARTGAGTFTARTLTGTTGEIDVTGGDGVFGDPTISLPNVGTAGSTNFPSSISVDSKGRVTSVGATAADLSAIEALNSTGIAVRTAANTWATRAITLSNICLSLTNGSGVAGNIAIGFRTLLCASLSKSGAQSIASNDSTTIANQTQITSWTDSDDYSINNFGSAFDEANGEFTVPAGDLYEIKFMVQWSFNGVNTWQTRIYIVHDTGSSNVGLAFDFRQDNMAAPSNVYQNISWMGYLGSGKVKFLAGQYNSSSQSRSFNSGRVCITKLSYGLE